MEDNNFNNTQNVLFDENYDLKNIENMNNYLNHYSTQFKENFECWISNLLKNFCAKFNLSY